jgi:hypothetical protein
MLLQGLLVAPVIPIVVFGLPIILIWLPMELAKTGVAFVQGLRTARRGGQSEVVISWGGLREGRRRLFGLSLR